MFSDVNFLGLSLYDIFFLIGIIACFIVLSVYSDKKKMPYKIFNFYLIVGMIAIIAGYFSAILFQGFYDFFKTGKFVLNSNTGKTFLGGLIGGVGTFLIILLFNWKKLYKTKEDEKYFTMLANIAPCCIAIAHAFGRIGCLCAGCCHGRETTSIFGWTFKQIGDAFPVEGVKYIPIQLYESVFLFVLFGILTLLYFKNYNINLPTYLIGYGVWRFIIEFFRADDRGAFFIEFLTPSQATSILMVIIGIALICITIKRKRLKIDYAKMKFSHRKIANKNRGKKI